MRSPLTKLALAAAFGLALAFTFSCSNDDGGDGGDIANADNEAWVACKTDKKTGEECIAFIFKQNGEFTEIYRENGEDWYIKGIGTYSIKGNQLTLYPCDDDCTVSYTISGNTLTMRFEDGARTTLTRTSGVYINSGDIANADNEAWTYYDNRQCVGLIFKQNGKFLKLDCDNGRNWCIDDIGDYSISGNQITICDSYDCDSVFPYSVSGNILTLLEEGKAYTYTKTSGVNIIGNCH